MIKRRGISFIIIGVLLLILGAYTLTFDLLVGMLTVGVGLLIFIKGYRLTKGIHPKNWRKQEEEKQGEGTTLKDKEQKRIRDRNSSSTQDHDK